MLDVLEGLATLVGAVFNGLSWLLDLVGLLDLFSSADPEKPKGDEPPKV